MKQFLRRHQRGAGMLEVLITVLILSTALIGLAVLQGRALQYNQGSYFRSQANIMAYDVLDRMRLYTTPANSWAGGINDGLPNNMTDLAKKDIKAWKAQIATSLPDGQSTLVCAMATRICTVTITWTNQNSSGKASEDKSTFTYSARL